MFSHRSRAHTDFPQTGNGTSTLTQFNGGLTAFASSTIGNGNQNGGLTIFGGATTTGNAYFGSNVGIGTTSPFALLSLSANTGSTNTTLFNISSTTIYGASGGSLSLASFNNSGQLSIRSEHLTGLELDAVVDPGGDEHHFALEPKQSCKRYGLYLR